MKYRLIIIAFFAILFSSCKKDNVELKNPGYDFSASPWILNEGSFLSGNAGVDVVYGDGSKFSNVYQEVNGLALGDVLQSGIRLGNRAFLVLNGSEKIQVVDAESFENKGLIQGISYPRYLHSTGNNKFYLSSGSLDGMLSVFSENSYELITSISVGFGPEKMCSFANKLFVCNSGGWSEDNTVSVINTVTDQEEIRIEVGDRPVDCACDLEGNVWILCSGSTYYDENWNVTGHSAAMLYKIDGNNYEILHSQQVGSTGDHPVQMELNPDSGILYLSLNGIKSTDSGQLPLVFDNFINGNFQALNVNADDSSIWLSSYSDFISPGMVYKYDESGNEMQSWTSGIGPNSIIFPEN